MHWRKYYLYLYKFNIYLKILFKFNRWTVIPTVLYTQGKWEQLFNNKEIEIYSITLNEKYFSKYNRFLGRGVLVQQKLKKYMHDGFCVKKEREKCKRLVWITVANFEF